MGHMEDVRPEKVTEIFAKHNVPIVPDYVSIDIDSCDLWIFLALTIRYRPRVITIEYNPQFGPLQSKTVKCVDRGERFAWRGDQVYGASLLAIHRAAQIRNY